MYYYLTNLQGDVVMIVDAAGTVVASYTYNAWGEVLTATGTLAPVNPLRYRGYYYDSESGLYYLKSRYYDPEICRFINADDASMLGADGEFVSYNLFAYCGCNPVNRTDENGKGPFEGLSLIDYIIIHAMVQIDCAITYGWEMEVYVKGPLGRGFLDLLDINTYEYYEVKSKGAYERGYHIPQMRKYNSAIIPKTFTNKQIPGLEFGSGVEPGRTKVEGSFAYGIHDVYYHWKEPGVIVYETNVNALRAVLYVIAAVVATIAPEAAPAIIAAA